MASSANSAVRALSLELKSMQEQPVEGFRVNLINDDNLFEWEVAIFGPPSTMYQGGYFKAHLKFPSDYPYSPPSMRFMTKVWHPNVYENGDLCISILHPPHDDPQSGELACERWNPTQNVRTILLSVISLLNEPNTFSPANVDASVMYRKWKESREKDDEYAKIVKKQVDLSKVDAEKDGVIVPLTVEDYCIRGTAKTDDIDPLFDCDYEEYYDMDDSSTDTEDEDADDRDNRGPSKEDDVQSVDMGMGEEVIEDGGSNGGMEGNGGSGVPSSGDLGPGGGPPRFMSGPLDFSESSSTASSSSRPGGSGLSSAGSSMTPLLAAQKHLSYQKHNIQQSLSHHHHHHHSHRHRHGQLTNQPGPVSSSSSYGLLAQAGPRASMDDNEDSGQGEN